MNHYHAKANGRLVEVYDHDVKVGEFKRNYDAFGESTFAPFRRDDQWYALYSPSYVALSVMRLPECEYIGGEDRTNPGGFCPTEVYIPQYQWHDGRYSREFDQDCWENNQLVYYENFAFVAGCVWGDDTSWKVEFRDITNAHNGVIKRLKDWGYYELPHNLSLKQCVHLYSFEVRDKPDEDICIALTITKTLRVSRNNPTEEYSFKDFGSE